MILIITSYRSMKGERMMQYTKLGNSDLNVSRICMGCMGFGDAANGQHTWTIDDWSQASTFMIRRSGIRVVRVSSILGVRSKTLQREMTS